MIRLASVIETFEASFLNQYHETLLPSHHQALQAIKHCRSSHSPLMLAHCDQCQSQRVVPHSCGHRSCPHCQHHESQQWIERQLKKQVPAEYFLLTFTLPAELRALARQHQRTLYSLMLRCSWDTLRTFAKNDTQLNGSAGAISVLHTQSRRLDYHPALIYLGRYLYKGVIQEKDILSCDNAQVTFRYQDGKTKRWHTRTLPGAEFLWLIIQHVLPKGFRRTRDFGFLHANSKRLIALLQWLTGIDPRRVLADIRPRPTLCRLECGASMRIVKTRIPPPPPALRPRPAG